jgi:predicted RNase H-like nuclease (RuvC/YqgF family)
MTSAEWGALVSSLVAAFIAIGSLIVSWRKTGPEIKQLDSEISKRANEMALAMLEEVKADNEKMHEEITRLTNVIQQKDREITNRDGRIAYLENQVNVQHTQILSLEAKVTALEGSAPC